MTEPGEDLPLIVQSDGSILLDVHTKNFDDARLSISLFAELEKSPEHMHTYRVSPLSLWNAASTGITAESIFESLDLWSRYPVPDNVRENIAQIVSRFGVVRMIAESDDFLLLLVEDPSIRIELENHKRLTGLLQLLAS